MSDQPAKTTKKTRDAKRGELREINILERIEKLSYRPESRIDLERMLGKLSPKSQVYVRHLVMSGASSVLSAAKACGLTTAEVEEAITEIEKALALLK